MKKLKSTGDGLADVGQVTKYFDVSRRKLYALVEQRAIPYYRVGKRAVRFDLNELRKHFAIQPRDDG